MKAKLLQAGFLVLIELCALLLTRPAHAFYTRGYFERSAALGGGGGLFYTGSARERGWDCSSCHVEAKHHLRLGITVAPDDFVATRSYSPGAEYDIEVFLSNETLGFDSQFNSNGFLAEFSQGLETAGRLTERDTTELLANGRLVSSRNDVRGLARWSFHWTAPAAGSGPVVVNLGAVDGDGAGEPSLSFQDFQGDDVYVAELKLDEARGAATPPLAVLPRKPGPRSRPVAPLLAALVAVLALGLARRRALLMAFAPATD